MGRLVDDPDFATTQGLAAGADARAARLIARNRTIRIIGNHSPFPVGYAASGGDEAGTLELPITPYGDVSLVAVLVASTGFVTGGSGYGTAESDPSSGIIQANSVVTSGRTSTTRISKNGKYTYSHDGKGAGYWTDSVGCFLKAGTQAFIRHYVRVALAPTSPAASAVAGGYLSAATYYYVITSIDNGQESGPTSEVSAAAASSNLAISLTWTANANAERYRVYRSAASGGTKQLIAEVGPVTQFVDEGRVAPNAAINPPSTRTRRVNGGTPTGYRVNYTSAGGNGSDQTATAATSDLGATGPANHNVSHPIAVIGDDRLAVSILCDADSRGAGAGTPESSYFQRGVQNFFDTAVRGRPNLHSVNVSINGATDVEAIDPRSNGSFRNRLMLYRYADIVCLFNGINDCGVAAVWQTVAQAKIYKARAAYLNGCDVYVSTTGPFMNTTDLCLSIANQAYESAGREDRRKSYNTWVRNGCQVDNTGYPVLTGGTPSPYIAGYVDLTRDLEVDSSNNLTPNGGYWRVPTAPLITGQIVTGSPTATSIPVGAASYPTNRPYAGMAVKFTSGARSGQVALINSHTANSITLLASGAAAPGGNGTVPGLSGAPAAGDTFDIWDRYCDDGLHDGTLTANALKAQAIIDTILTPWGL